MSENNVFANDVAQMKKQVNEMYTALVGNSITKDGGLVRQMADMRDRQDDQDGRLKKMETALVKVAVYVKLFWISIGSTVTGLFSILIKK